MQPRVFDDVLVRGATPAAAAAAAEGHARREERNCRLTRATLSLKTRAGIIIVRPTVAVSRQMGKDLTKKELDKCMKSMDVSLRSCYQIPQSRRPHQ